MIDDRRASFATFEFKEPAETRKVVQSMEDVMRVDSDSIWHSGLELDMLYELAYGMHNAPGTKGHIIHCGMHRGGSICVMGAALCKSGSMYKPVIGFDPYWKESYRGVEGFWGESYRILRENIHHFGLSDYVCPIIFKDTRFLSMFSIWTRLVFIDTSPQYDHKKEEIRVSLSHLVDNGYLVFHDYCPAQEGVITAVNEFIDNQTNYHLNIYNLRGSSMVLIQVKRK